MSITTLTVELVTRVCSYLERPEWTALRLTCSFLYLSSLDAFTDQWFRSIRFIATSDSLREALASNETIRTRVRELWMIPTVFEGRHNLDLPAFGSSHYAVLSKQDQKLEGEELEARYAIYQAMVADHCALLESEDFSTRLHDCFARFFNLESVGLQHYTTSFLLNQRQHEVRCLGLRQIRDQIDLVFRPSHLRTLEAKPCAKPNSLAISRLLRTFLGSNQSITPRGLHTCGTDFCSRIPSDISLTQVQYDSLLLNLQKIEDLHMCISYDRSRPKKIPNPRTSVKLLTTVAPISKLSSFHSGTSTRTNAQ
jgi:hypothetical protein